MAVRIWAKRVSVQLDDEARARLRGDDARRVAGYASSGSDHGTTTCLSGLVHAFLETGGGDGTSSAAADCGGGGESDHDETLEDLDVAEDRDRAASEAVRALMSSTAEKDSFRTRLATDVFEAAEGVAWLRSSCGASAFRRAVMARLRAAGYNAGICKARWNASGGLAAGNYEYIDVVAAPGDGDGRGRRFIVDLDFAAEFEVARPTEAYKGVVACLPRAAVAGEEAVRQVVRAVADAARRSLRARGLHVPPWRKSRYMLAKWLGPYRRTTNPVPTSLTAPAPGGDVKCRAVGFPTAATAAAPTARTR
ncbi:plant-specific domain TIGR01615 family protein [Musa troglodytarum]|uniref:Plant-specific domain TIGR01615 family protein n=1 Tax=Musa troglodytarum TaxID=320322 RepID=A0A9E7LE85_9LILI|nr:plant-specific domain TIGR01615 family protein [Musa troglodytarum]